MTWPGKKRAVVRIDMEWPAAKSRDVSEKTRLETKAVFPSHRAIANMTECLEAAVHESAFFVWKAVALPMMILVA